MRVSWLCYSWTSFQTGLINPAPFLELAFNFLFQAYCFFSNSYLDTKTVIHPLPHSRYLQPLAFPNLSLHRKKGDYCAAHIRHVMSLSLLPSFQWLPTDLRGHSNSWVWHVKPSQWGPSCFLWNVSSMCSSTHLMLQPLGCVYSSRPLLMLFPLLVFPFPPIRLQALVHESPFRKTFSALRSPLFLKPH